MFVFPNYTHVLMYTHKQQYVSLYNRMTTNQNDLFNGSEYIVNSGVWWVCLDKCAV